MEMFTRNKTRRCLFAVAIFFGVSSATAQTDASQTEYVYPNNLPVVEMEFFNDGEFSSTQNFSKSIIDAAKYGTSYWRDILDLQSDLQTPWQIALTKSEQQAESVRTHGRK